MMKKTVQLYANSTKLDACRRAERISAELIKQGYQIVEENADIVIGFGGDGTLLHFLRQNNYQTSSKYIGVNCGTLGFLQDFNVTNERMFVEMLPTYVEQHLRFICIEIEVAGNKRRYKALNEFTIQDSQDRSFRTSVSIGGEYLESFVGTGLVFSTPTGSTALNLSAGGCILYPGIEAIQMTPREAIANSKMHCLSKSICLPKGIDITLMPNNSGEVKIYSDGENVYTGCYDNIRVYYSSSEGLIKLKDENDSFIKTIKEKLI